MQKWKKEKEKALEKAPERSLRICKHGKKTQYYHRNNPKDFNGVDIKEKDIEFARKLTQKDYDKKVLGSIEQELRSINKYFSCYPKGYAEQIYGSLHVERQKIITPIIETEEEYVRRWEQKEYEGKAFYADMPGLYTLKDERVRSKSELIIADMINKLRMQNQAILCYSYIIKFIERGT